MVPINFSKIGSDSYVLDMTIGTDSISVRVSVPSSEGARIFSDVERERGLSQGAGDRSGFCRNAYRCMSGQYSPDRT